MAFPKVRKLLLAVPIAVLIAAVATLGATASRTAGPLDGKKVGLEFCTDQNPFCAAWIKAFKGYLEGKGATVTVLTSPFDPAKDASNMNQLIAGSPDLIAVTPADPNAIVPSLARAQKAGIKLLNTIGRLTPAGNKYVVASVLTDNAALARFAAQNIDEGLKRIGVAHGQVMMLTGTATQLIVQDRVKAFKAELAKRGHKLVATQDTNWDQATSAKVAQQLLAKFQSKGGIQAAYGMADNMAVGIIQGAQQAGVKVGVAKKGLIVSGSNCLSVGIKAIRDGLQFGTATQAPLTEATAAAKAAEAILLGKAVPKVSYVTEYRITKANVGKFAKLCSF